MSFSLGMNSIPGAPPPELWVSIVSGHGSTNTCIPTFTNCLKRQGNAPIWIPDAVYGDSFKIVEDGLYFMEFSAYHGAGSMQYGVSLNVQTGDGSFVSGIQSLANTPPATPQNLGYCVNATGVPQQFCTFEYLKAGDVVRAHDDNQADTGSTNAQTWFKIIKISGRPA
jgi:hypothetical protein